MKTSAASLRAPMTRRRSPAPACRRIGRNAIRPGTGGAARCAACISRRRRRRSPNWCAARPVACSTWRLICARSSTYLGWVGVELSAEKRNALFIPAGLAHGFLTLEDSTEVYYQMGAVYDGASSVACVGTIRSSPLPGRSRPSWFRPQCRLRRFHAMKRILLTGVTGFIGAHCLRQS